MWDAIVIGSGIGGLAAGAALARHGRRVLLLERHSVPGGLTQTFRRRDWSFATGVHYVGGVGPAPGPDGQFGRLLAGLTGGTLQFQPCANPYDIVRLPGFEFGIPHPESAYRAALVERFPDQRAAIDGWFDACESARRSAFTLFALHGMPGLLAWVWRGWHGTDARRWAQHTLADELSRIPDPRLAAVLGARWGDHGAPPATAPFAEHALVTGSYNGGAWFPVGGPARFAQALLPPIEGAGGALRTGCEVRCILTRDGRAAGVEYEQAGQRHSEHALAVISAMGVANTVDCLAPEVAPEWQQSVRALRPGLSYLSLYLGFDGDIAAAGASSANHWIYGSSEIGTVWSRPGEVDAPSIFVSFPSLKDPASRAAPTAEVVAMVDAHAFAPWLADDGRQSAADYRALKAAIEQRLLAQFLRHFPALQPLLRFHELATPVTQRRYLHAPAGAAYGVEMSAERLTSPALHARTPLPGLLLAGQDVVSPGIQGAFMGGMLAAAQVEPSLWADMRH